VIGSLKSALRADLSHFRIAFHNVTPSTCGAWRKLAVRKALDRGRGPPYPTASMRSLLRPDMLKEAPLSSLWTERGDFLDAS